MFCDKICSYAPLACAGSSAFGAVTVRDMLNKSSAYLKDKGSASARLDAELLLAEVLNFGRIDLYTNFDLPLKESEVDAFRQLVKRRAHGEPVAYILGRAYFRNLTLRVSPAVLIPRPETEHLVEEAVSLLKESDWRSRRPQVLDLGTGSGAIAIAIAASFAPADFIAADSSNEALELARENACAAGMAGRISFVCSDLFQELDPTHTFDIIITNPPYISETEWPSLPVEVRKYEPRAALWGGEDGLDYYRRLVVEAPQFLKPLGSLMMEIGYWQAEAVTQMLGDSGCFEGVEVKQDYAGHDRVIIASRREMRA